MLYIQKEIKEQYVEVMGQAFGVLVLLPESPEKESLRMACKQFFDRQANMCFDHSSVTIAERIEKLTEIKSLVRASTRTCDFMDVNIIIEIAQGFDCRIIDGAPVIPAEPTSHKSCGKLMKEHICPVCGAEFQSNRQDAQYCGVRCKQAAYRERKKI